MNLTLGGSTIQQVRDYKYLGITIGLQGIKWNEIFEPRLKDALQTLNFFDSKGMHCSSWRFDQSLLVCSCSYAQNWNMDANSPAIRHLPTRLREAEKMRENGMPLVKRVGEHLVFEIA